MKSFLARWDGEVMRPVGRFAQQCAERFKVDQLYRLVEHEDRSETSHSHYFAALTEGWRNLPEDIAERFPTPEHLRKWALIKTGHAVERSVVCDTPAAAKRVAGFVSIRDRFSVIVVKGPVVTEYTAKSQSRTVMDKAEFQKSKQDVLDLVASMIAVPAEKLLAETKQGAA